MVFTLCVCVQISSSCKDTGLIGLEPIIWPHFNLITSLKTLSRNTVIFLRYWGFNIWIWGGYSSAHNSTQMLTGAGLHLKGEFLSLPVMFRGKSQDGPELDPSWLLVLRGPGLPPPKNLSTPLQNWCWVTHFPGMLVSWENGFRQPAEHFPHHKGWTLLG